MTRSSGRRGIRAEPLEADGAGAAALEHVGLSGWILHDQSRKALEAGAMTREALEEWHSRLTQDARTVEALIAALPKAAS